MVPSALKSLISISLLAIRVFLCRKYLAGGLLLVTRVLLRIQEIWCARQEILWTYLVETEIIVSRVLQIPLEIFEDEALTPNHFPVGTSSLVSTPEIVSWCPEVIGGNLNFSVSFPFLSENLPNLTR